MKLRRRMHRGYGEGAAADEKNCRLSLFFSLSAVVLFFTPETIIEKHMRGTARVCKSSNVERWSGRVNSAHGAWRLTNIQNASVSTPEGRWESVKLNEWIQMRNFELLFELCHKIWICVTSSVQWHLFILRTYTVKTVWILSVRHFPLRLDQWLSA